MIFASIALCVVLSVAGATRIHIENNEYRDILIALPSDIEPKERSTVVSALEGLLNESSRVLRVATRGRAVFRSATVLVPHNWDIADLQPYISSLEEAKTALTREDADIVITGTEDSGHPYTLHHEGCGRQALRIYWPFRFLTSGHSNQNSVEFVRLWSEFRYGLFPEGGFNEDKMYPAMYPIPGESSNKTTGCRDEGFDSVEQRRFPGHKALSGSRISESCLEDESCSIVSSIMDQHLPHTVRRFCENEVNLGPKHEPQSPSKHNLLCKEEGAWFTVLQNEDFKLGRNSPPRNETDVLPSVVYVRETLSPAVMVAIDLSARMRLQSRYSVTTSAFARFVYSNLPDGSQLTLFTFGGDANDTRMVMAPRVLTDQRAKVTYLERQPLPEEPTADDNLCSDCVLDRMLELVDNGTVSSPVIILVATRTGVSIDRYSELKQKIQESKSRLHVLYFPEEQDSSQEVSLYTLCMETRGSFVSLQSDPLSDIYRAFSDSVQRPARDVLISQEFLPVEDEKDLALSFFVDESISGPIRVLISGPSFGESPLEYEKTRLSGPMNASIHTQKQELLPAWIITMPSPQAALYTLTTRRKEGATSPVLVTVVGSAPPEKNALSARVTVDVLFQTNISPPPVRIFAEVRKGPFPVAGAAVLAYVHHPRGEISTFPLIDDGRGDIDITKEDGIYSESFTNFTNTGFYNVYIEVTEGVNNDTTEFLKGSSGYCCGSFFAPTERRVLNQPFQRTAGPVTFEVSSISDTDVYPPSRVTDLRLAEVYDSLYLLRWTAVGDNYSQGFAKKYELKLFPDRSLVRNRFSDSGLEIYNETIDATPLAAYGTPLVHILNLPKTVMAGVYYFAVRGVDEAGNAGDPSNTLPVWVDSSQKERRIDCSDNDLPISERLNSASKMVPLLSVLFWILLLHHV